MLLDHTVTAAAVGETGLQTHAEFVHIRHCHPVYFVGEERKDRHVPQTSIMQIQIIKLDL